MREIKFRVWNSDAQKYVYSTDFGPDWSGLTEFWAVCRENEWHEVEQYTGLRDRSGVDIYEGDLWKVRSKIRFHNVTSDYQCVAVVEMSQGKVLQGGYERPVYHSGVGDVIGNIRETPELLDA